MVRAFFGDSTITSRLLPAGALLVATGAPFLDMRWIGI